MSAPPEEKLTAGEERFELWRKRAGFVVAPLAFSWVWYATTDLPVPAHRLAAILTAVIVLWLTEAIPMAITAFLGVSVAVMLGVAPVREAFAPFADPLIFLFIGTFMLAHAIFIHGLDRRFAFSILALPGVGSHPMRVLAAYSAVSCLLSMWISNTATTAMMFPIGISILAALERDGRRIHPGFATALLLSNSLAASIGGLGTPVGTPPNLIGIGFIRRETGFDVPFFSWMALGVPVVLLLYGWMLFGFSRGAVGMTSLTGVAEMVHAERSRLGAWTRGQVNTIVAFSLTVAFWVLPGLCSLLLGQDHALSKQLIVMLPEGVVALLGATLLFLLPINLRRNEFTLSWADAVRIDWWIVFLYGGGIALGTLAFSTGLAEAMGRGLTQTLGIHSAWGLLALSTVIAAVLSETTSNTASANMVVPVVIAFARSADIDPLIPALGATFGASLGFMLPVSTPCNAIVYGSGRIPLTSMIRYGITLDLVGVVIVIVVLGFLGPIVLGR